MPKERPVCEFIDQCKFHKKFGSRQSNVWQAVMNMYCRGHSKHLCEVYIKFEKTGTFLPENIMPTGRPVSLVFQQLP